MRLACLVLVSLISGCIGGLDSAEDLPHAGPTDAKPGTPTPYELEEPDAQHAASQASPGNATSPRPPPPMRWEGGVTFGMEAGGQYATCNGPFHSCDKRSFSIKGTFDVNATLSWGLATNDFDLYLYRDTGAAHEFVSDDGINGPNDPATATQELHYADLPPGNYRLYVVPRHAVYDAYELDAVFS